MLPKEPLPIVLLPAEKEDGVAYVSGMQGLICTTFLVEDYNQPLGENNPKPVCFVVALATPRDIYQNAVRLTN